MTRKFAGKSYILARLGFTKLFWRIRGWLSWLNFRRLRTSFKIKSGIDTATSKPLYWRAMSKGTLTPIAIAVIVGVGLYVFERNLSFFVSIDWIHNGIIGQYLLHALDNGVYAQMLTTIAGVTGVFLGLHLTAVSTVISNAYSSVSGDVRGLVLKDRLGNNYVKLVAFLTALSVILLAFSATNVAPLHLAIPTLAIISCLAIFAFVNLGLRTFFLSDPTLFFSTLSSELLKWVKQATYRGYQWHNPNFQEHYRKQALRSVTTLTTLAEISGKKPELQGESYPRLLRSLLALTDVYYRDKHSIPSDSEWYGKKFQHKQWYLTESTEVDMATNTDTTLQPTKIPNTTWLEDAVLGVVFDAFKLDIDDGNYKTLYDKIISLPDLLSNISNHWLADDAKKWHLRLSKDVLDKLNGGESTLDGVQEPYSIAVVEILASLPLSIELGFVKAIMDLDVNRLRKQLNNTDWSSDSSPYGCILPQSTVKILEQMHSGVAFEKQAHSINKTPNWYITELALHDLELALYDQWQSIMKLLETWYIEAGKILSDAKKYKQSATVYSRAIEQAWKLDSHIEQLKVLSEALRDNGKLNFLKNAEWDWDKEHERVGKFRDLAIKGQAELIPHLWNTEQPSSDLPDFFGGAVHRTGEACYDVLASGDTDGFSVLFRPYFLGILGIFDSVRPQVLGWETSSAITWMSEPMLDLFDVSGYAYIYAEYYNKPDVWNECKKIWDACLSKMPLQLQSLAVISNYHQTPRGVITPRAMLRSRWQQELAHTLNKLPRQGVADFYSQPEVQHDSKLIRNIAPWKDDMPFMHVDAIDVFTVKYLLTIPTDDKLDFGIRQDKITNINGSEGGDDA